MASEVRTVMSQPLHVSILSTIHSKPFLYKVNLISILGLGIGVFLPLRCFRLKFQDNRSARL